MTVFGFEDALWSIKRRNTKWRRLAWKPDKWIEMRHESSPVSLSYIQLRYATGVCAPWAITRCDMLENDWVRYNG